MSELDHGAHTRRHTHTNTQTRSGPQHARAHTRTRSHMRTNRDSGRPNAVESHLVSSRRVSAPALALCGVCVCVCVSVCLCNDNLSHTSPSYTSQTRRHVMQTVRPSAFPRWGRGRLGKGGTEPSSCFGQSLSVRRANRRPPFCPPARRWCSTVWRTACARSTTGTTPATAPCTRRVPAGGSPSSSTC